MLIRPYYYVIANYESTIDELVNLSKKRKPTDRWNIYNKTKQSDYSLSLHKWRRILGIFFTAKILHTFYKNGTKTEGGGILPLKSLTQDIANITWQDILQDTIKSYAAKYIFKAFVSVIQKEAL